MSKKRSKLYARILAIILSVLMVVSMAYFSIYMVVETLKNKDKTETTAALPAVVDGI